MVPSITTKWNTKDMHFYVSTEWYLSFKMTCSEKKKRVNLKRAE